MSEATFDRPLGEDLLSADGARPAPGGAAGSLDATPLASVPLATVPAPGAPAAVAPTAAAPASMTPAERPVDRSLTDRAAPPGELSPRQRAFRHWLARAGAALLMKTWFRVTIVGRDRILPEPAMYVFNHLSWMDPLVILATFPSTPPLHFYGPKEVTLQKGIRNRLMLWTRIAVPFSPHKDDLLTSVRRAQAVFDSGAPLAISAEGSIHVHEGDLLPFEEGAAYLALRAGVPIVPVAITGTSWAHFRGRVLVRIGEPIPTGERPTRQAVARYTAVAWHGLKAMVADDRDLPVPGPIGRWFTDLINDWGPGGRAAASLRRGPDPADVPVPTADGQDGGPRDSLDGG
jgi:1-acyl-sn-glycerol-3-phosphate acyltransferase